jgi:enamine deaminase RidA (YjgF/YER057c/UK114 family)
MTVRLMNAPGLCPPPGYSHVGIGTGSTIVFMAGQVPLDADGAVVGPGDHRAQTEQAMANLLTLLEASGATPEDVVKTTVYVVGGVREARVAVWDVVQGSPLARSPSTLVGVDVLGYTDQLVEIEAVAIIG